MQIERFTALIVGGMTTSSIIGMILILILMITIITMTIDIAATNLAMGDKSLQAILL